MHDKYGTSQDPSCYPGSNQLINLLDIHSTEELEEAELVLTSFRLEQFPPNFNDLTFDYLKNIHHFLFQDIYPWAGQVRSIDISKGSTRFCIATNINQQALKRFQLLADAHYLQGLEIEDFISYLSEFYCEMNVVHPFREGNGRSLRLFCEMLALQAGFELNWKTLTKQEWLTANIQGYKGNLQPFIALFSRTCFHLNIEAS